MIDDQLTACGIHDRTGAVLIDGSPAKLVEKALSAASFDKCFYRYPVLC